MYDDTITVDKAYYNKLKKIATTICYKCNNEFLSENAKYILLDYRSADLLTSTQISYYTLVLCPKCRVKLDKWLKEKETEDDKT